MSIVAVKKHATKNRNYLSLEREILIFATAVPRQDIGIVLINIPQHKTQETVPPK